MFKFRLQVLSFVLVLALLMSCMIPMEVSATGEVWLDGNGISLEVDNRGAVAAYYVDGNGVKTAITKTAATASLSGYVNIGGNNITDFTRISYNLESSINGMMGAGKRLTVISQSAAASIQRTLVLEVANSNPGVAYAVTKYKALTSNITVSNFYENDFTLNVGSGTFWSYQGCADAQGADTIISINNGYSHTNTQGPLSAGVPFSYVYNANGGLGIGDAATIRTEFQLPITGANNTVNMKMKWNGKTLAQQVDTTIGTSLITVSRGDYYSGLRNYALAMKDRGISAPEITSISSINYDSRWESWGFEFNWSISDIVNKLDELVAMGIKQVTIDDGWYNNSGDWGLNTTKFPNGDSDMKYLTDQIHSRGMKAVLWWRPGDGGINSTLVTNHPDWFVRNSSGNMVRMPGPGGGSGGTAGYSLCPTVDAAVQHQKAFIAKAISTWGYDGFKGDYAWGIQKCYASGHNHASPYESMEQQYKFYKAQYDQTNALLSDSLVEMCNCGTPQDFYSIPYVTHVPTADPISLAQTRTRLKADKAIFGDKFPVTTDHNSVWFPSAMGTGSVMITKYKTLTSSQTAEYTKWFGLHNTHELQKGEFIGDLYRYGIDPLETYVIKKDTQMYYGLYKDSSSYSGNIEFRGLDSNTTYRIEDYENNVVLAYGVTGPTVTLTNVGFYDHLLVRAVPDDTVAPENKTTVNDSNTLITYSGNWTAESNSSALNGDAHYTTQTNSYAQYTFTGTSFSWVGQKDSNFGKANVYIDGTLQSTVDCYSSSNTYQNVLFSTTGLASGTHTAKIVCLGQKNASSSGYVIDLDALKYTPLSIALKNLALGKTPTTSATFTNISRMTDGDKATGNYMDSYPNNGLRWAQIDLGASYNVNEVKLWHYYGDSRKYHDVIVQLSNDSSFASGVTTVFNNDIDNSAGRGAGTDVEYNEISTGKNINFNAVNARYVRLYSNGSSANASNHYVELEVYDGVTTIADPLYNAATYLNIATYDGGNQSTHPDVLYFSSGWNGHKYWMLYTPNRTGTSIYENPSVAVSEDGIIWSTPSGITNPISPMPTVGHNCDTELYYNSQTNELWAYWVEGDDISQSWVCLSKSSDGITWSTKQNVITTTKKYDLLSPTIQYKDSTYYMWSVNTGNTGYNNQSNTVELRTSTNGINWSTPTTLTGFDQAGYQIWHIDVNYIPSKNEYWAVFPAYADGTNSDNTKLFFAKSTDRINWTTYSKPILKAGAAGTWDSKVIYRSAFMYDQASDRFRLWYGAISTSGQWQNGYTENTYTQLINALN